MSGKELSFVENFALSGCAAIVSRTAAAPIERVKLLIQNQVHKRFFQDISFSRTNSNGTYKYMYEKKHGV